MTPPPSVFPWTEDELRDKVRIAVLDYWNARGGQASRQQSAGVTDTGARGEVTGGQHLNAFCELLCDVIRLANFKQHEIRYRTGVELPGFFRPTKKWDIIAIRGGKLCAVIEMKSQVGPSFGNNANNRTEESIGSAVDLWTAYREGVLGIQQPWLGYFFLLEETARSTRPIKRKGKAKARGVRPAFSPMKEFANASYAKRYELLFRRLVTERHYSAAALILSPRGGDGRYSEPDIVLSVERFVKALYAHLMSCT
jgi:hypothetical protein